MKISIKHLLLLLAASAFAIGNVACTDDSDHGHNHSHEDHDHGTHDHSEGEHKHGEEGHATTMRTMITTTEKKAMHTVTTTMATTTRMATMIITGTPTSKPAPTAAA